MTGSTGTPADPRAPRPPASAEDVERAWNDTKLAQVLYHDWEAQTYDDKWSISFDERCISYARDRFTAVAGTPEELYGKALEIGAGTGFFSLNLRQAGVLDDITVTDISPGMVDAARRNARGLGFEIAGEVADAESLPFADETFDIVVGHAVNPDRLGWGWAMFAYKSWLRLSAADRVLARVVPRELFYNVSVTAVRPS
jgi:SAM-dependent methyltransferase